MLFGIGEIPFFKPEGITVNTHQVHRNKVYAGAHIAGIEFFDKAVAVNGQKFGPDAQHIQVPAVFGVFGHYRRVTGVNFREFLLVQLGNAQPCSLHVFQPVQLLWVNLVTDCFPALALGMEDAEGDIMKRKPRNAKDGVFAGNMGLDCVVQGLIITVLVLASFFVGVYFDMGYIHIVDMIAGNADEEGVMMAFITLNMVEIFHCFNMRSRRASLFTMKKQNKWLWASAALALVLTVIVTVQPTLAEMFFGPVTLELKGVLAALGLAFLIIPLMEIYKAIMRAVEKE